MKKKNYYKQVIKPRSEAKKLSVVKAWAKKENLSNRQLNKALGQLFPSGGSNIAQYDVTSKKTKMKQKTVIFSYNFNASGRI